MSATADGHLVVIEAPGKTPRLQAVLSQLAPGTQVWATGGHVYRYEPSLWPLGITVDADGRVREAVRGCNRTLATALRQRAAGRVVVLATDGDDEGDVIARDAAWLCRGFAARFERMTLGAMDRASIEAAWLARAPWSAKALLPGDVRRIVDRSVASTCTRPGTPVGRVLSRYLVAARRTAPVVGHVKLTVPATDGGRVFSAYVPVRAGEQALWRARVQEWQAWVAGRKIAVAPSSQRRPMNPAWGFGAWILHGFRDRPAAVVAAAGRQGGAK